MLPLLPHLGIIRTYDTFCTKSTRGHLPQNFFAELHVWFPILDLNWRDLRLGLGLKEDLLGFVICCMSVNMNIF